MTGEVKLPVGRLATITFTIRVGESEVWRGSKQITEPVLPQKLVNALCSEIRLRESSGDKLMITLCVVYGREAHVPYELNFWCHKPLLDASIDALRKHLREHFPRA